MSASSRRSRVLTGRQPPYQKAVDRTEAQLAAGGARTQSRHGVEQPRHFQLEKYGSITRPVAVAITSDIPSARIPSQRAAVRQSCHTIALYTGTPVSTQTPSPR